FQRCDLAFQFFDAFFQGAFAKRDSASQSRPNGRREDGQHADALYLDLLLGRRARRYSAVRGQPCAGTGGAQPPPLLSLTGDANPVSAGGPPPTAQNPRRSQRIVLPDA